MDIHETSVDMDMDMDMDVIFHIHGNPVKNCKNHKKVILLGITLTFRQRDGG